eukprot:scaffold1672_cov366-Prasinococcus_capsulatus_cf.AAC.4
MSLCPAKRGRRPTGRFQPRPPSARAQTDDVPPAMGQEVGGPHRASPLGCSPPPTCRHLSHKSLPRTAIQGLGTSVSRQLECSCARHVHHSHEYGLGQSLRSSGHRSR